MKKFFDSQTSTINPFFSQNAQKDVAKAKINKQIKQKEAQNKAKQKKIKEQGKKEKKKLEEKEKKKQEIIIKLEAKEMRLEKQTKRFEKPAIANIDQIDDDEKRLYFYV